MMILMPPVLPYKVGTLLLVAIRAPYTDFKHGDPNGRQELSYALWGRNFIIGSH